MKLSEIQKLRWDLLSLDLSKAEQEVEEYITEAEPLNFQEFDKTDFTQSMQDLRGSLGHVRAEVNTTVTELDREISKLYAEYLLESEKENEIHIKATVEENRLLRTFSMRPETEKIVKGRLGGYINWKHPGMEIGPGDGHWTASLVALDPLYVVDIHQEFLDTTRSKFTPEYQARLRTYLINGIDFSALPKKQMGFVFAWNVFNYFSLGYIEQVLLNLKTLLKPGAVVMFSYNNCDRHKCTELFERHHMSFVPNSKLIPMIHNLGYEVIRSMDLETHVSWIEIKLNGYLDSNRAGQTLGKIIHNTP